MCPEVFVLDGGSASLTAAAKMHFKSYATQILDASRLLSNGFYRC